jgi:hypothetical protein
MAVPNWSENDKSCFDAERSNMASNPVTDNSRDPFC